MDNIINYIIEAYDDMKKKTIWDYLKSYKKRPYDVSTFYEIHNTSIQSDSENSDSEYSNSDRLSYIISMNTDEVFSPNPSSPIGIKKKPLDSKDVLKLHIEGKIYDPFIKNKLNNIRSTDENSYIRRKSKDFVKSKHVKSIPELNDKTDYTEVPEMESTILDKRNTITFPANVVSSSKEQSKMFSRADPPPPPLPPRNHDNLGVKIAEKVYLNTDLDQVLETREVIKKREDMIFNIKRRFKHLAKIIDHVAPTDNITRDLTSYEIDEVHHILKTQDVRKPDFDKIYYLADSVQRNINRGIRDNNNYYITCVNDHILFRYRIVEDLGRGCYGKVIRCYDHKHNKD